MTRIMLPFCDGFSVVFHTHHTSLISGLLVGSGNTQWPSCKTHRLFWHLHYWSFRVITIFVWIFLLSYDSAQDVF